MRKPVSKVAGMLGMAVGIAVIGGSIIGGIAVAADDGPSSDPGVTEVSDVDELTDDDHGDDADDQGDDSPEMPGASTSPDGDDDTDEDTDDHEDDDPEHEDEEDEYSR